VTWSALFGAFVLSHLVGDFLVQTDWQAMNKQGGLGRDTAARRALATHVLTYTLAFVPALVWTATEVTVLAGVGLALLIAIPHAAVDDGRFVSGWVRRVKGVQGTPPNVVRLGVDQSLHVLALGAVALVGSS
jgi:Protein of unknown function (DUF3307)